MWGNLLSVLIGGLLALVGSLGSQWLAHHLSDRRTRRAIAGAFAGEIGAICSIVRTRKYLEVAGQFLAAIEQTQQPLRITMTVTQDYLTVYHANANAIGLLPAPLALDIARFYTQLKSLLEDVRPEAPAPTDASEAKEHVSSQIGLLTDTLKTGDALVSGLLKVAQ